MTNGSGSDVIPSGHPETGVGGASYAPDTVMILLGGIVLAGAGVTASVAVRRRRIAGAASPTGTTAPGRGRDGED